MTQVVRRLRSEHCVSDLRFDRLLSGELEPDAEYQLAEHVARCPMCSARQREIEAARSSFDLSFAAPAPTGPSKPLVMPSAPAQRAPKIGRPRVLAILASALALAAGVWLVVLPNKTDPALRIKGAHRFGFFVLHAGEVRQGGMNEPVMPGDRIRFVARSSVKSYVVVLSRDGAGQASIYHPLAREAAPLAANVEQKFDSSVVLDDTLGEESLHALFCTEPLSTESLRATLQAQGALFSAPPGCEIETIRIRKVAAR